MASAEQAELAAARARLAEAAERRRAVRTQLTDAAERLAGLRRDGAPAAEVGAAAREADRLRGELDRLTGEEDRLAEVVARQRERLRRDGPERAVEQLEGGIPVALLPVRLETRFGEGNTTLRVRVFPEQLHVDTHEPELTADELVLARAYWEQRWAAGDDGEARRAAWTALARSVRPTRARWLVTATTPTNLDQLGQGRPLLPDVPRRNAPWTRAPRGRLLPEQWVALGYRAGTEVFRAWSTPVVESLALGLTPDPDAAEAVPPPAEQEELPVDEAMAWLVDYGAALEAGMAITVTDADLSSGSLAQGLDELVVVGVDWTLRPADAAAEVAAQLVRHASTDGLALLGPGTATNNTEEDRAASGTDPRLDVAALDPTEADPTVAAEAARVSRALGLADAAAFDAVAGRGLLDDRAAADMHGALWAATLGTFFDQMLRPLVSSRTADALFEHFRGHVRGRGPLAALRVGRQPYGVLPVLAGELRVADPVVSGLARQLAGLRPFWAGAAGAVPRLGDSDRPDLDLVELLRRTPWSQTFRFREAAGITTTMSLSGFAAAAQFQERFAAAVLAWSGVTGLPQLARVTVSPHHRAVPVPLVTRDPLSETDPLDPDYISAIRQETELSGGFRRLLTQPGDALTLLEALLRQSAGVEYTIASTRLVVSHELATEILAEEPRLLALADREVFGVTRRAVDEGGPARVRGAGADATSLLARVAGPAELAGTRVAAISGDRSLADFIAVRPDAELLGRPETARFAAFRRSLDRLAGLPTAVLARLAADTLDCAAHRLDAWITSLAWRQLDELRGGAEVGVHVGAFGYVEDLVPRATPASLGYLQAPSIAHATTAAVLRSAHLARRGDDDGILALDLSSTRVSLALDLVDGVRRGQPIGVLLGYRFERGLRERRIQLARYILPFRQAAPLAQVASGPDDGTPLEVIAARDVVDGLRLLQRWKADADGLFAGLSVPVTATDRGDVEAELRRLDDTLDALSDVLVAEGVHQAVLGNTQRSAAALDALDRQALIPDLGIVRTPRTGRGVNHRLLLLFPATDPAPGWEAFGDARREAEPRVDAWAGAMLGDPDRYRFAAEVHGADGTVLQRLSARLAELELSALSTVCACAAGGPEGVTEVEERLALFLGASVSDPAAERLVLLDDPPPGSPPDALGLRDLLELGAQLLDLLAAARPADRRSLSPDAPREAPPDGGAPAGGAGDAAVVARPEGGFDVAELRGRADRATAALRRAVRAVAELGPAARTDRITSRLLALASAGLRRAVPATADPEALRAQAAAAAEAGQRLIDELAAADAAFDRAGATPAAAVAHDLGRLRRIFGTAFPVVAAFTLEASGGAQLAQSRVDPALLGGDPLAPARWLSTHAAVRTGARRLADALAAVEMLVGGAGLEAVWAAQLPHAPGARWLALRRAADEAAPAATLSLVAHSTGPVDPAAPLSGLVVDQWSDVVPNDHETTGVSFHFDAPGARAPQTILLAVPGDPATPSWTVEALASTVREALALARIRALDGDDLDAVGRLLPAIYLPFNLESRTPSVNLAAIIGRAVELDNTAFLAQGGG